MRHETRWFRTLYVRRRILNSIPTLTRSQWREANKREIWSFFLVPVSSLSTAFWIRWRLFRELLGCPVNKACKKQMHGTAFLYCSLIREQYKYCMHQTTTSVLQSCCKDWAKIWLWWDPVHVTSMSDSSGYLLRCQPVCKTVTYLTIKTQSPLM